LDFPQDLYYPGHVPISTDVFTLDSQPGLFTSGAVLALRTILFSRTDSHFASLIPPHPIGETADMAKNADSAAKKRLFPC
jgi:hypothetical protein